MSVSTNESIMLHELCKNYIILHSIAVYVTPKWTWEACSIPLIDEFQLFKCPLYLHSIFNALYITYTIIPKTPLIVAHPNLECLFYIPLYHSCWVIPSWTKRKIDNISLSHASNFKMRIVSPFLHLCIRGESLYTCANWFIITWACDHSVMNYCIVFIVWTVYFNIHMLSNWMK